MQRVRWNRTQKNTSIHTGTGASSSKLTSSMQFSSLPSSPFKTGSSTLLAAFSSICHHFLSALCLTFTLHVFRSLVALAVILALQACLCVARPAVDSNWWLQPRHLIMAKSKSKTNLSVILNMESMGHDNDSHIVELGSARCIVVM